MVPAAHGEKGAHARGQERSTIAGNMIAIVSRFKTTSVFVYFVAAAFIVAPMSASATPRVASHAGDVTVTQSAGRVTTSSHRYRNQLGADLKSFWTTLAGRMLQNVLVLHPKMDSWWTHQEGNAYNGCGFGGCGGTWPISVRRVSYKLNTGTLNGSDAGPNAITINYATSKNYVKGTYTLKNLGLTAFPLLQTRSGTLGYDPVVRAFFDAVVTVVLAAPTHGPVVVRSSSVTVSNIKAVGGDKQNAAAIDGIVANLGSPNFRYYGRENTVHTQSGTVYTQLSYGLTGAPFPGWTNWLQSNLGMLLSSAAPGFSSVSRMNNFLANSKKGGANTTQLTYSSVNGISLVSSGPFKTNTLKRHPSTPPHP